MSLLAIHENYIDRKKDAIESYLLARPKLHSIPDYLERDFADVHIAEAAAAFTVSGHHHELLIEQAKRQLESVLPGATARRRYELRLAAMIQRDVLPKYATLDRALGELPEKLRNCRDHGMVGLTAAGDVKHHWPSKCNQSKICAHEARGEAMRLTDRYLQPLFSYLADHQRARLQYLVISPRNVPIGELAEAKRDLFKAYSAVNRRALTKNVVGGVVVQEDPLGRGAASWNVHLNALIVVEGHFSWKAYRRAFADELGQADVQIEFIDEREMQRRTLAKLRRQAHAAGEPLRLPGRIEVIQAAFMELIKYVTKIAGSDHAGIAAGQSGGALQASTGADLENAKLPLAEARPMDQWPGGLWFEWWMANKGFRRSRSYGVLYRVCDRCGSYHHSEIKCPLEPEPAPFVEWIGFQHWDDLIDIYVLSIDLIPADNFTIQSHDKLLDHTSRGPPGWN